jgi:hypothetical protein
MKILCENFSRFYDSKTKVEFAPVLDRRSGCYVGIADVEDISPFENRTGYKVLTDADFLAMTTAP